jgi:type IV secretion system protein VirB9
MKRVLAAAALLALSAPALADDPRLVERVYDPARVVTIEGKAGVQATIRFADGEHIENVAIGDSAKWQVTPNRRANILFVKPLADRATTNMTVVTDRYTYLFDLVASPAHRNPLYVLSFSYPEALEEARLAAIGSDDARAVEAPTAVELAAATDPYAVLDPAALNYAWSTRGDGRLLPALVYDDGEATFLTWAPGAPIPAILVKDHEGTEGPVNFAVRGDVIVVDGVPREIVLRLGKDTATLRNTGPAREPRRMAAASRGLPAAREMN